MKQISKQVVCVMVCLLFLLGGAIAFANPQLTIVNKSGHPLYVYDFDESAMQPTPLLKQLAAGQTFQLTMQPAKNPGRASRRIYFAASRLNAIEKSGLDPDPFNPTNDGNVMFSFAEYNYESANSRYTVDTSYIDVFSYPVTLTFAGSFGQVFEPGHEYGPKSFAAIAKALQDQGGLWANLVWKDNGGMKRIVGPDKVWPFNKATDIPPQVPQSYRNFWNQLPPNGKQLFQTVSNFDGWRTYYQNDPKNPNHKIIMNTGYVKALLSAATPDKNKKHGFYIFPKDSQAEFTNLPLSVKTTITVYSYEN